MEFHQSLLNVYIFSAYLNVKIVYSTKLSMINIFCCLQLKSKQISELSQKRGFNVSTRVIGYADSEYVIVNNI